MLDDDRRVAKTHADGSAMINLNPMAYLPTSAKIIDIWSRELM
jgi:hypothetical protein